MKKLIILEDISGDYYLGIKNKPQHLYLIDTNAEIKGYYHDSILNAIRHTGGAEYEQNSITNTVISTTNKSLNLPLFSEQSIKLAIDYFNRIGKKEVEICAEIIIGENNKTGSKWHPNYNIYYDITIQEEKMYSKEEVIKLLNKLNNTLNISDESERGYQTLEEWIDKNL